MVKKLIFNNNNIYIYIYIYIYDGKNNGLIILWLHLILYYFVLSRCDGGVRRERGYIVGEME